MSDVPKPEGWPQHVYEAGESNRQNDWDSALDDVLPESLRTGVSWEPSEVADYIEQLQTRVAALEDVTDEQG